MFTLNGKQTVVNRIYEGVIYKIIICFARIFMTALRSHPFWSLKSISITSIISICYSVAALFGLISF